MMMRAVVAWLSMAAVMGVPGAETCNASDFVTEVISYTAGSDVPSDWISGQPFNDPNCALGRPTIDTTGDGWDIPLGKPVPVVHVYPAFRSFELVTVGNGGELIVRFDHPVENDPANPYGVDLAVFGNASQIIGGELWENGDPNGTTCGQGLLKEPGIVSVAQYADGPWYTFSSGPYADDFGPTLGRMPVDDPNDADWNLGEWNVYWGGPTDPTRPLDPNDPNVSASGFAGKTVRQMCDAYNGSAGGTGFDIGAFGLDWIQYVRVEDDPDSSATTEIDALADVAPGYVLTVTMSSEDNSHVVLSPDPVADPPPAYFPDTEVVLTAVPAEGKTFRKWVIYDPNYPGDANWAVEDSNAVTTIVMTADREVLARFMTKFELCGIGAGQMLPLLMTCMTICRLISRGRRRRGTVECTS